MATRTKQTEHIIAKCQGCGQMFELLVGATEEESNQLVLEAIDLHYQNALKCADCVFRELGFDERTPN
jgi:hypothetical protein